LKPAFRGLELVVFCALCRSRKITNFNSRKAGLKIIFGIQEENLLAKARPSLQLFARSYARKGFWGVFGSWDLGNGADDPKSAKGQGGAR
jgi:hypothetical protein